MHILILVTHFLYFAVSSSQLSGRARSDPTHQHLNVHSHTGLHSGQYGMTNMECESPSSAQQSRLPHTYQSGWTGHDFHHQGRHSNGTMHTHRHAHRVPEQSPSSHTSSSHSSHASSVTFTEPGSFGNTRYGSSNMTSSTTMALDAHAPPGQGRGQSSVAEPPQIGAVNMQLSGYQTQYGQYPNPAWSANNSFPYATMANPGNSTIVPPHEATSQHARTNVERSEDSPMVGVCVQQSPVASH